MTSNLKALLIFLGVSAAGVGAYIVKQTVTAQQVRDELADSGCVRRDFACPFYFDGGYVYRAFPAARCADDAGAGGASFVFGLRPDHLALIPGYPNLDVMAHACHRYSGQSDAGVFNHTLGVDSMPDDTPDCICAAISTDGGTPPACTQTDGGPLPLTGSYPASAATGPGCIPRICHEFSGYSAAPPGCNQ